MNFHKRKKLIKIIKYPELLMAYDMNTAPSSDEFSTLGGYTNSVETPKIWAMANRTGYKADASYLNQTDKNIMIQSSATLSSYGALAGRKPASMSKAMSMVSNNNRESLPAYQTAPSTNYFTFSTEMDTQ